ncbi:MAG: hypothetical protein HF967_07575 [Methanosarcinales archaeon]|nr:hypothetical protein [Methanosarcinales archaeon]
MNNIKNDENFLNSIQDDIQETDPKYETISKLFDDNLTKMTSELSFNQINLFIVSQSIDDYTRNKMGYKKNTTISLTDKVLTRMLNLNIVMGRKRVREFITALHRIDENKKDLGGMIKDRIL